ncbi:hypothetical protein [Pectobacterium parvum]|uniref:hypothetical protein n=1 Tax=Pectobacterium parvum TaxID=2778550 RepID=UPI0021591304|nr:hypothetical protein [Pectobacterium parvum]UVD99353.1 hypothetical protein NV347_10380 [Pectobacterium parvum]
MRKKTGGPAFPVDRHAAHALAINNIGSDDEEKYIAEVNSLCSGMTLRDYFAAKAMQGWLSSYGIEAVHPIISGRANAVAENAYALANAMLKAREVTWDLNDQHEYANDDK